MTAGLGPAVFLDPGAGKPADRGRAYCTRRAR